MTGNKFRIVAIIQARMSSSRLPNKVLMPLEGKPVLHHIINRLKYCRTLDDIVVATSTDASDDKIQEFCEAEHCLYFRGSLNDVLNRYYSAALHYRADFIVRITADCPVIDPVIVDTIVTSAVAGKYDLFSLGGSFPDGLDCSIFSKNALEQANLLAALKSEREHVGPFIEKNPTLFKIGNIELFKNLGHLRWTLDEKADYDLIQFIYQKLFQEEKLFLTNEILNLVAKYPQLLDFNSHIIRNEGYIKSLKEDHI